MVELVYGSLNCRIQPELVIILSAISTKYICQSSMCCVIMAAFRFSSYSTVTGLNFFFAWTMFFNWLLVSLHLLLRWNNLFVYFLSLPFHLSHQTTLTERLYFIIDTYVKSRENPEHQYWPDQSRPIREKIRIGRLFPVLAELYYLYHKSSFHLIYVNITVVNQ